MNESNSEKRFFRFWGAAMIFSAMFGAVVARNGVVTLGSLVWCGIGLWLILRK